MKNTALLLIIFYSIHYCYGQNLINQDQRLDSIFMDIQLSYIEGGTFIMGSDDSLARKNETPHMITVGDFAMMKYETTVNEFKRFIDATGYVTDAEKRIGNYGSLIKTNSKSRINDNNLNWRYGATGELRPITEYNHPVIHVSYSDAVAYANWLSKETGQNWRLPTEAEWEYAAKGGQDFLYAGSNNINDVGWFSGNSGGSTHQVGQKKPNKFGLYDMTGNVWEMCSDRYDYDYYKNSPMKDPIGPDSGRGRVLRGGCWSHNAQYCRTAQRHHRGINERNCINGFRLVIVE
ncbi:MAG: formylglycine-generating enzyme family protein [Bacteroidetes bacterium]|nr:formylglycine-generating enzyme family protein [Bacteroidota bacterium]